MKYWKPPPPRLICKIHFDEIEIREIEQLIVKLINVDKIEIKKIEKLIRKLINIRIKIYVLLL